MTKLDKLVAQIRARPTQARFADVQTLMEAFGWRLVRQHGSHAIFRKDGEGMMSIPKVGGQHVRGIYLDTICKQLGLDDEHD